MKRLYLKFFNGIKISSYFRELSLVMLGIIITFGTTAVIENKTQKKEFSSVLGRLNSELLFNLEQLEIIQNEIASEISLYNQIKSLDFKYDKLNEVQIDALFKEFLILRTYNYQHVAFEVFSLSKYIHEIEDEELVFQLIQTYQNLCAISNKIDVFYENKQRVFREQTETLTVSEWDKFILGSEEKYFDYLFENIPVRNFLWSAFAHFNDDDMELTQHDIQRTIEMIMVYKE